MTEDDTIEPDLIDFTDAHLFELIASKNDNLEMAQKAYEVIYDRYATLTWNLCNSACRSFIVVDLPAFIDEVFSQTMIAIYEYPTYKPCKGKVTTWISRIAQNKAKDLIKDWPRPCDMLDDSRSFSYLVECDDLEDQISPKQQQLNQALAKISEKEKDIIFAYMMYQDGNKHLPDEILNELRLRYNTTSENIRQIKKRAMFKLGTYIQQLQSSKQKYG